MHKVISVALIGLAALTLTASTAWAHVVVKPADVGVAAFQTFTTGVPNEKDNPTVALRLVIPDGLNYVTPNVKAGWKITVKETGDGDDTKVTEISWTGGSIPVGQRDEFVFSAQVPAEATTLIWKAYQTYQDGSVVAWDQDPDAPKDVNSGDEEGTPYSKTAVVDDLDTVPATTTSVKQNQTTDVVLSSVAIVISLVALMIALQKKKA